MVTISHTQTTVMVSNCYYKCLGKLIYISKLESTYAGPVMSNVDPETEASPFKRNPAAEKMFKTNYPRLQEIKAKYDPKCLFNRWFNIEPKTKA
jgi:hypothetical protein